MATILEAGYPSILNLQRAMGPDGMVNLKWTEILNKLCPLYEDIPMMEANGEFGHTVFGDLSLPTISKRRINDGVPVNKGEGESWVEPMALLEKQSSVDTRLGNGATLQRLRNVERRRAMEAFRQAVEATLLTGNAITTADDMHGFFPRYASTAVGRAAPYVLKRPATGHAGDNSSSILAITWDPDKVCGIYRKGGTPGIRYRDLGEDWENGATGKFRALQDIWEMDLGLAVNDYRYVCRGQYDPNDAAFATTAKGLYLLIEEMLDTLQETDARYTRIYMSRATRTLLNQQIANNAGNPEEFMELDTGMGPRSVRAFRGFPIRISEVMGLEASASITPN